MGRNNTEVQGRSRKAKGGCLPCVRGSGPLRGGSGELSMTGRCQGTERQEVSRASFLPEPRTEMGADFHPVCGAGRGEHREKGRREERSQT